MDNSSRLDSIDKPESKGGSGLKFKPKLVARRLKQDRDASAPPSAPEGRQSTNNHTSRSNRQTNRPIRNLPGVRSSPATGPFGGPENIPGGSFRNMDQPTRVTVKKETADLNEEILAPVTKRTISTESPENESEDDDYQGLRVQGISQEDDRNIFPLVPIRDKAETFESVNHTHNSSTADQFIAAADGQIPLNRKLFTLQIPSDALESLKIEESNTIKNSEIKQEPDTQEAKKVGRLKVHQSGKVSLEFDGYPESYSLETGIETSFLQLVAALQTPTDEQLGSSNEGDVFIIGETKSKFVAYGQT